MWLTRSLERRSLFVPCALAALLSIPGAPSLFAAEGAASGYELALVDLRGHRQDLGRLPPSVFAPRVSPDGRQVAFELAEAANAGSETRRRIWVAELAHPDDRRALPPVGQASNWAPVWSTDGERIAFLVSGGTDALYWRRADGTGEAEHLVDGRSVEGLYEHDRYLVFITRGENRDYGISLLDLRSKAVTPLVDRPGSEQHSSRVSPDGRWIAYASNETGRHEIWLAPLPPSGKRYAISVGGGSHPQWAPDGRSIYFDLNNRLYRVPVFLGAEQPKAGDPKGLPIRGFVQGDLRRQYDLMPDGRHFLMLFPTSSQP